MLFALALSINEDVIKIHNHKNVELLCQDLVDITLECSWYIGQTKRHDLVLEVTIAGSESRLPFIAFPDPYLMISIGQVELGETSSPT